MIVWNQYVKKYEELIKEVTSRLEKIKTNLYNQFGYSPIEKISARIKSETSAIGKLQKKNLDLNVKNLSLINDIAGIRIICKFLDDIPEILSLIKGWPDIKIIKEKDFISEPKISGYRSRHIVCCKDGINFEIQLRTMAMDFWATNEHMLKYKYGGEIPVKIVKQLQGIAKTANSMDTKMNKIRKEIQLGTVTSRIVDQIFKSVHILEEIGFGEKASYYRQQLIKKGNDLDSLRRLAVRAREDVPNQYWK